MSLYFTFKTESGSETPKIKSNCNARIGINRITVDGGENPNAIIKIPKTTNSKIIIIEAVIPALNPGMARGK